MEILQSKKLELTIYQPDQEVRTKQTFSNLRRDATTAELTGLAAAMIQLSGGDLEGMYTVERRRILN